MSETLTQTLARNPLLGSALAAGDALPLLDVSGTGLGKDAAILLGELRRALATFNASANSAGNTTITPGPVALQHLEVITITGAGGTRVIILAGVPAAGCLCRVRFNLPATPSILLDFRAATAGGTQLTTMATDGSGDDAVAEFYHDGSAWQFLKFTIPANA
ncbi:MAG: hypothetical protein KGL54_01915 [Sphingomonadales bacterium]|nr:hypothetical protein [Sphingomonadales bacterium]